MLGESCGGTTRAATIRFIAHWLGFWSPSRGLQPCYCTYGKSADLAGPEAVPIKEAPRAFWAAIRHNVIPGEYFAYALWRSDRRANIDSYLYSKEGARLFRLLNQPSQPDPIDDKLAFYQLCKAHDIPTPAVLAAFAPTAKLLEFESGRPPPHDLFVKPRNGLGGNGSERFRWQGGIFREQPWLSPERPRI